MTSIRFRFCFLATIVEIATPALLKVAPSCATRRNQAKLAGQHDDHDLLARCCAHPDPDLQAAALGAMCHSRSTAPEKDKLELILSTLCDSATVPCTKFRQRVAASLKSLVAKCREEAAKCCREQQDQGEYRGDACLKEVLDFLDRVPQSIFLHLLPGGNYQRRSFALDLIQVCVNNLFEMSSKEAKRSHGNSTTVLTIANKHVQLVLLSNSWQKEPRAAHCFFQISDKNIARIANAVQVTI